MYLIDTSSWVNMARYFLPFDKASLLKDIIIKKLEAKEIVIIDKVYAECRGVSQKIVINAMPFLKEYSITTDEYIASVDFHRTLVNHLCNSNYRQLPPEIQEVKRGEYLNSADCKLVLFGIENKVVRPVIVTEENQLDNDQKYFKKLPVICNHPTIDIPAISLTEMLKGFDEIDISFIPNAAK